MYPVTSINCLQNKIINLYNRLQCFKKKTMFNPPKKLRCSRFPHDTICYQTCKFSSMPIKPHYISTLTKEFSHDKTEKEILIAQIPERIQEPNTKTCQWHHR